MKKDASNGEYKDLHITSSTLPTLTPTQKKILETLEREGRPLTPKEISNLTGIALNTVRIYLSKMAKQGTWVKRVSWGSYTIQGAGLVSAQEPPWSPNQEQANFRVHDLTLTFSPLITDKFPSLSYKKKIGDTEYTFTFGAKNKQVTCWIANDSGLDYNGFSHAIAFFKNEVWKHLGIEPTNDVIYVARVQTNQDDRLKWALDGVKCITVEVLDLALIRIYKKGDKIRKEIQPKKGVMTAEQVMAWLQGGITTVQTFNMIGAFMKRTENLVDLVEAVVQQNKRIIEENRMLRNLIHQMIQVMGGFSK